MVVTPPLCGGDYGKNQPAPASRTPHGGGAASGPQGKDSHETPGASQRKANAQARICTAQTAETPLRRPQNWPGRTARNTGNAPRKIATLGVQTAALRNELVAFSTGKLGVPNDPKCAIPIAGTRAQTRARKVISIRESRQNEAHEESNLQTGHATMYPSSVAQTDSARQRSRATRRPTQTMNAPLTTHHWTPVSTDGRTYPPPHVRENHAKHGRHRCPQIPAHARL